MNTEFVNALFACRHTAGMTQERAAEVLNISTRSMSKYESGTVTPSDAMVAHMVKAYEAPWLGYLYLSRVTETGKLLLPAIEPSGVSSQALHWLVSMRKAAEIRELLENISADDKISQDELDSFKVCISRCYELASACLALKMGMKKAG